MQWIKSHLTVVIAGSLSLLALVMMGLGFFLSDAAAGMEKDLPLLNNLDRQRNDPVTEKRIAGLARHKGWEAGELRAFFDKQREVGEHLFDIASGLAADLSRNAASDALRGAFSKEKVRLATEAVVLTVKPAEEWLVGTGSGGGWYRVRPADGGGLAVHAARGPLHAGVFPGNTGVDVNAAYDFQGRCKKVLGYEGELGLLLQEKLKARDAPTEEEFRQYVANRKEEKEREARERGMGISLPSVGDRVIREPRGSARPSMAVGRTQDDLEARQARRNLSILQARSIYCYASPASLDRRTEMTESNKAPGVEEMWYAQVSLWLQEDVLDALGGLNEKKAQALLKAKEEAEKKGEKGEAPWVGNLPVKRLRSFRLRDYVSSPSESLDSTTGASGYPPEAGGGRSTPVHSSDDEASFTGRGSDDKVDVIHFELDLVIDATQLLQVMNAISSVGLFTPIQVSFKADPPTPLERSAGLQPDEERYVYGPVPTIGVTLVYEACFPREDFEPWMPDVVRSAIETGQGGGMSTDAKPSRGGIRMHTGWDDGDPRIR